MSYSPATIPNLAANEVGYQLTTDPGNGCYVAARWESQRDRVNSIHCRWHVRQVSADGSAVHDAAGNAVTALAYEATSLGEITAIGGLDILKQRLLDVAMGDAAAERDVPDDIRDAIQAAALVTG